MSSYFTNDQLKSVLEIARFAPSVHNSQPWKVHTNNNIVYVNCDADHLIVDGDPTTRQYFISLGIFLEALLIGLQSINYTVVDYSIVDLNLEITISNMGSKEKNNDKNIELLKSRATDRSIYSKTNISEDISKHIAGSSDNKNTDVIVVKDLDIIDSIADYTSSGIMLAMSNPEFRQELSKYLVLPWSNKKRGISVKSLYIPYLLAILQPILVKFGTNRSAEANLENRRWKSASAVVIITSSGDMPKFWLEAGRVYLKTSLAIEESGLSQATSAAIVEASNYHEDVEELIGTDKRILSIIRVGAGSQKRHYSPRISTEDLAT